MSRRPIAQVRVLRRPDLAEGCVRVEIECRFSMTGITSIPSKQLKLTVPVLVTAACYEQESRCGECDTSKAHQQGDQALRTYTDQVWDAAQTELGRYYAAGRRN